ncbi:hypothetical protein LU361_15545 [Marinibactrum sp. C21]|nr:hypothetical protein [Sessilibacter corallicola]MCE2029721.1 hypothetical protein [Sessilibacter corallicola]
MDFTTRCKQKIRDKAYQSGGYKIRPHGIGMEINIDGVKIDFDFGHNGEVNGFDAWRLFNFVSQNNIKSTLNTEQKIKFAVEQAVSNGSIYKVDGMGSNYYVSS